MKSDTQYVSPNRQKKEALVAEFSEKVQKSKAMVFANYQGLTHQQLETLKKAVRKVDGEFIATKNSLILRALEGAELSEENKKQFEQPTATLFMFSDIVEPIKLLAKTAKEHSLPKVKFGLVDGKVVSDTDVMRLATLPALPVMRAQFLGTLMAPVSGLHRALRWNLQSLVMTLNAVSQKKAA